MCSPKPAQVCRPHAPFPSPKGHSQCMHPRMKPQTPHGGCLNSGVLWQLNSQGFSSKDSENPSKCTLRRHQPPYTRAAHGTSRAQTQPLNHHQSNSKIQNNQTWYFTCIASKGVCCSPSTRDQRIWDCVSQGFGHGGLQGHLLCGRLSRLPGAVRSRFPKGPTMRQNSTCHKSFPTPLRELT